MWVHPLHVGSGDLARKPRGCRLRLKSVTSAAWTSLSRRGLPSPTTLRVPMACTMPARGGTSAYVIPNVCGERGLCRRLRCRGLTLFLRGPFHPGLFCLRWLEPGLFLSWGFASQRVALSSPAHVTWPPEVCEESRLTPPWESGGARHPLGWPVHGPDHGLRPLPLGMLTRLRQGRARRWAEFPSSWWVRRICARGGVCGRRGPPKLT